MEPTVVDHRCVAFRVGPDAWRHPDITWAHEDLIELAAVAATCDSPPLLVQEALGRVLPGEGVRS